METGQRPFSASKSPEKSTEAGSGICSNQYVYFTFFSECLYLSHTVCLKQEPNHKLINIMCLLLIAYNTNPQYPLIIAANRDEFYHRPTEEAHFWKEPPDLLAGKDKEAGGTWLGITRSGRFAAITNYRDMKSIKENAPSRGALTLNFLASDISPFKYGYALSENADKYNGYNLIFSDMETLFYFSNQTKELRQLPPGVYGLSNHLLDTPWPKVVKSKASFLDEISKENISPERLFEILADDREAPDTQLPDTGLSIELERAVSPVFIKSDRYGTRSSTVLLINDQNDVLFIEKSLETSTGKWNESRFSFQID